MKDVDSSNISDDKLYSNFIQGQTESFDELTIRYGDALVIYLSGILHNMQDAEDITELNNIADPNRISIGQVIKY